MTTWLPDSSATKCAGCKSNFSLLNRKHHCRTCGRVFCQSCSSKKIDLSHIGIKKGVAHRVCNYCFKLESKRKFWIEKACPALKIGSIVLHLGRFSSSTRILKLSEDEKRIEILEFESKKLKDSINIHHIKEVIEGKTTPHLKKSNQISALCFAILVNSSTYEFEAEKAQTKEKWCKSLKAWIFVDTSEDPKELGNKAKTEYLSNQYDSAKMKQFQKNQSKRNSVRNKWKLNKK